MKCCTTCLKLPLVAKGFASNELGETSPQYGELEDMWTEQREIKILYCHILVVNF